MARNPRWAWKKIKKVRGGWKVISYYSGKTLKRKYKTRDAALRAWWRH